MILSKVKNVDRYIGAVLCSFLGVVILIQRSIFGREVYKSKDIKKILFIKFWGLGNMVLLMPIFKAARGAFKGAEICLLTLSLNKDIMETFPYIDNLYLIDTSTFFNFLSSTFRALKLIRRKRFDMLVDFEVYVNVSSIFSFFSRADLKAGITSGKDSRGLLYDVKILYKKDIHITKVYSQLLEGIDICLSNLVNAEKPSLRGLDTKCQARSNSNLVIARLPKAAEAIYLLKERLLRALRALAMTSRDDDCFVAKNASRNDKRSGFSVVTNLEPIRVVVTRSDKILVEDFNSYCKK